MKKKILLLSLLALTWTGAWAQTNMEGYLIDVLCGEAGFPEGYEGKIDLTKNPERNVVGCLIMDNCKATGFGISLLDETGTYVFHPLDAKGNELIVKTILPLLKKMGDPSPYLRFTAQIDEEGNLVNLAKVERLAKKPAKAAKPMNMEGHGH